MKKKQFVKCSNITIGKQLLCQVINPKYNDNSIEVEIIEGIFKGSYAIVNLSDVIIADDEIKEEGNTQILANFLDKNNIEFESFNCGGSYICVEGDKYQIYIAIDESGYYGSTKHLEREIGFHESEYKNERPMTKVNTVMKYIEKFL